MQCSEIMEQDIQLVRPDDEVGSAAKTMRDAEIGFLPVCDPKTIKLWERLLTETLPFGWWRKERSRRLRCRMS
jgi:CBS-domain-containing membrane protein